jgi:hypothetical protein
MPRGKVYAPPASTPSKGLTGACSRCKNPEIGAADKKRRKNLHALDTGEGACCYNRQHSEPGAVPGNFKWEILV